MIKYIPLDLPGIILGIVTVIPWRTELGLHVPFVFGDCDEGTTYTILVHICAINTIPPG